MRLETCFALLLVLALSPPRAVRADELATVKLIATGGTIAMKIDPVSRAAVPAISGDDLLATVPEIERIAHIEVENFSNIPSDYMTPEIWVTLRRSVVAALEEKNVAGVVISHGTDTIEETAYFLDLTVDSEKPIVLIGALRNASEKDFDGPRNLINAARVAVSPSARGKGAMIVINGQINAAREATKTHASSVESFKSGDFGFLGVVDADRVVFSRAPVRRQTLALSGKALPDVRIAPMYAGTDGSMILHAVDQGAKGIVVAALGLGNVNKPMYEAIRRALANGVHVAIATQTPNGRVLPAYGFEGGGRTLADAGAVLAGDLSARKARILLMLALQHAQSAKDIQHYFDR
jgi:L-asparaginase